MEGEKTQLQGLPTVARSEGRSWGWQSAADTDAGDPCRRTRRQNIKGLTCRGGRRARQSRDAFHPCCSLGWAKRATMSVTTVTCRPEPGRWVVADTQTLKLFFGFHPVWAKKFCKHPPRRGAGRP